MNTLMVGAFASGTEPILEMAREDVAKFRLWPSKGEMTVDGV